MGGGGVGGYDSTSGFFVFVQGNSPNMDSPRKNIVARISTNETVNVMEDKITLKWQSQRIVCYIVH